MARRRHVPGKRWPWLIRIVIVRPRLFLSFLAGLLVIVLLTVGDYWAAGAEPKEWPIGFDTNLLIGWDIGLSLYLAWSFQMFAHCTTAHMRREALLQDEGSLTILLLVIVTAALSMVAIIVSLGTVPGACDPQTARSPAPVRHHRAVLELHPDHLRPALRA